MKFKTDVSPPPKAFAKRSLTITLESQEECDALRMTFGLLAPSILQKMSGAPECTHEDAQTAWLCLEQLYFAAIRTAP